VIGSTSGSWASPDSAAGDRGLGIVHQTMMAELSVRGDSWERGVRMVRLENDRVSLEVAVDRGMDIPSARIDGIPVGWRSPVPVVGPWFAEPVGYGTLRGFYGGLLTTGGLDHVGPPADRAADRYGYQARSSQQMPLHGRLSNSPATLGGYGVAWVAGSPVAWVEGEVTQVSAFGEHLVLLRRLQLRWGATTIEIADTVTNRGYAPQPVEMLYHVNAGWPVVRPGSRVTVLGDKSPLGPVQAPDPLSLETVRHLDARGRERGEARVEGVLDDGSLIALGVEWDPERLPGIVEWRVRKGAGHYAVGLEPTTRLPADAEGEVPGLAPGESATFGALIRLEHTTSSS
jgi:hypothetical protein